MLLAPQDSLFGIHDDLEKRYNTSRPTLRQVMRVLEHEKLVVVKRGWGGGYFTRRPDHNDTIRMAALDLKLQHCTLEDAIEASDGVMRTIARLATQSTDDTARNALADALDDFERLSVDRLPLAEYLMRERELTDLVSGMAANPALALFMSVLYELGGRHVGKQLFRDRPDRVETRARTVVQFTRAVVDGDVQIVDLLSVRASRMLQQWLEEDGTAIPPAGA
ncbi:FadR/GntR family transcriptional regulator [Sphingomonas immobilis]|uniref:FadR family transcriptional regulator n=1 Tax=Sphingomonas immobilis TaxID=3063997 RepID=A0ABT9A119_9SPHN|nr:hypothetical protein [Sphingomonas sp. CA1-15]MDO7843518.1 hypothetical protein [Sphingomonas sp. CA1-15]